MDNIEIKQNYVLVEPISMKQKMVGSILVAEDIEDVKIQRGRIVGIGDGILPNDKKAPLSVKVGEVVLYPHNTGHSTRMNYKDYLLIKEDDILAVLED